MAETAVASVGWGGGFWFFDGTLVYEAKQVVSFTLPNPEFEEVESTHLKSANRYREFIDSLVNGGEVQVVLNFRPLSDTHTKLLAWRDSREIRAIEFHVPESGTVVVEVGTTGKCNMIDPGEVAADGKMEATVTIRIATPATQDEPA